MKWGYAVGGLSLFGVGTIYILTLEMMHYRIESIEERALTALQDISKGQASFREGTYYGEGRHVYANPRDGRGLVDLYQLEGGRKTALVTAAVADAAADVAPASGYYYASVPCEDYEKQFAVCATPAGYARTGRHVYFLDTTGVVYRIDPRELDPSLRSGDRVKPLAARPSRDELMERGWLPVAQL